MFKKVFVLLLFFSFVSAQFGIRAEAALGQGSGDGIDGSISVGTGFGITYDMSLAPQITLQTELMYTSKASGFTSAGFTGDGVFLTNNIDLNPLIVFDAVIVDLIAGPGIALKMGDAKFEINDTEVPLGTVEAKSTVLSLYYGIGFSLLPKINFQFKMFSGLSDVAEDPSDGSSFKNNGFKLSAGISL